VRVPTERATTVTEALESVPEEKRAAWRLHRVASGDTLASIARRYSTAANSIVAVNQNLDSTFFEAPEDGELLLIPAAPVKEQVTAKRTSVRRSSTRSRAGSAVQVRSKRSATTKRVASNTAKKRAIAR
jgi:murein DD-endopeptidase MepM/ murein hydrolase activator NlpD